VFGEETVIGGFFRELIEASAFDGALERPDDVRAQFNHDSNLVLGRTKAGTLVLREDETGLAYEISPPDTSYARDLMVSVARGDVSQSSFMFDVTGEAWEYPDRNSGQLPLRKITGVKLYDVAPVTFPAYEGTSVSARAMALKDTPPQAAPTAPPDYAAQHLAEQLALDAVEAQG
jgi:HK97 family phage prohead protease